VVIKRDIDPGQTVEVSLEAKTLFNIANDLHEMEVHGKLDEADIGQVKPGQKVTFTVDAYPNHLFTADVRQVRMAHEVVQNVVTYTVIISARNPELLLFPGMTANLVIGIDESAEVLKIPNQALRFKPEGDARAGENLDMNSAIFPELLAIMNRIEFHRLPPRLVVKAFVMGIEAGRQHVRALILDQSLALLEATIGNAVLNDGVAFGENAVAQALPTGDVEIRQLGAVLANLFIHRVRTMEMADRCAGIDAAHIFRSNRLESPRRRIVGVRRVRHGRIACNGDDQLVHAEALPVSLCFSKRM
jgi:Barrel-sandwich domain of CusB or HlyD membrane-fusion